MSYEKQKKDDIVSNLHTYIESLSVESSTSSKYIPNYVTLSLKQKEKGCTEPLYGKKSKCIIKIVPQEEKEGSKI